MNVSSEKSRMEKHVVPKTILNYFGIYICYIEETFSFTKFEMISMKHIFDHERVV